MSIDLYIQRIIEQQEQPSDAEILKWVKTAIGAHRSEVEMTIRITDKHEIQYLNHEYRQKNKPTNVLAFPLEQHEDLPIPLLGDLVVCAEVIEEEAKEQNKDMIAHWAHIIIHGTLHLLGYDHIEDKEAEEMESLETTLMQQLGYNNPYADDEI